MADGVLSCARVGDTPRLTETARQRFVWRSCRRREAAIHDTWDVSGLAGTGSQDFTIQPVFVPEDYSYHLRPGAPRGAAFQSPLYRFPFWGIFTVPIGAVALGIAQSAVDSCMDFAQGRGRSGRSELHRDRPTFQAKLAESVALLRSARAWLHTTVTDVWNATIARGSASLAGTDGSRSCGNARDPDTAATVVRTVYTEAGGSANYRRSPLQRALRDVHAATQHVGVGPHWFEETGRLLLGLSPSAADHPRLTVLGDSDSCQLCIQPTRCRARLMPALGRAAKIIQPLGVRWRPEGRWLCETSSRR